MGFLADEEVARLAGQARNLMVGERLQGIRYVIRDRDARYTGPFDEVFRTKDVDIVKPRSGLRERTRSPSGGSARSGPSALTGYWCSAAATWSGSFGLTPLTTTGEGRTAALTSRRRT
jgi:hypothetical protein